MNLEAAQPLTSSDPNVWLGLEGDPLQMSIPAAQKIVDSASRLAADGRYGEVVLLNLRIQSMGNPAGSNRWGLPHLGLAIGRADNARDFAASHFA